MNGNETRTLWISIGAALFAVLLLYSYTQSKTAEINKKLGKKDGIVVAKQDIREMETIDDTMLEVTERPLEYIEPNALKSLEEVVGKVALAPIRKGEQLLKHRFMNPGPVTGLSVQVAPGKRAVSLPIDETRGVSKLLKPGDRIDIIASLEIGKGINKKLEVRTLMQDVVILATGLRVTNELPRLHEKVGQDDFVRNLRGDTSFNNITVEANPSEAQNLIYILTASPNSIFYTLRHPSDHTKQRMPASTLNSVLGKVTVPVIKKQIRPRPRPRPAPVKRKKKGPFIDL